jgi:hypothetical protein
MLGRPAAGVGAMTVFAKVTADPMALTEPDLRLLRVLDALLDTGGVMRAADRLCVTPSAVSHSLRALRERFVDPLFVRVGAGMQPKLGPVGSHAPIGDRAG